MSANPLFGLMQDKQLMISDFISYAQEYHPEQEVVSRDAQGEVHRYNYGKAGKRARQLASALLAAGVRPGEPFAVPEYLVDAIRGAAQA